MKIPLIQQYLNMPSVSQYTRYSIKTMKKRSPASTVLAVDCGMIQS